jgi:glycosyltransferase involved in cell wall biosynthesis
MTKADPARPVFSVIICTVNRPDLIPAAVRSVLANDHPSFELIILDQSKDDSTERALAELIHDGRVRYHRLPRAGLSYAYNQGISLARGMLLAFTDDDCSAPPDWLRSIEQTFEKCPDVDLIYGQTLIAPELADAAGVVPTVRYTSERRLGRGHGFKVGGMGANFAMRSGLTDRVGGFDEALGGGGPLRSSQDFDFLYRVYRANAICLMTPAVWVYHYGLRNGEQWPDTMRAYGIGDGAFYFKHVRCRDMFALRLLVTRIGRLFLRESRSLLRKRRAHWTYLRSYFTGIRMSMRYDIDKNSRVYRLDPETT